MASELFANNAESTIDNAGGITSTGTSITLPAGEGARFPAAVTGTSQFRAVLVDPATNAVLEYVTVTNRATDTLTVTRESEDATRFPKAARAQGVKVVQVVTSQVLQSAWAAGGGDYYRSGYYYYGASWTGATTTASGGSTGWMFLRPFWVPVRRTFDRIGVNVMSAAASSNLRLGIYTGRGLPSALLVDAGTVDSTTTGAKAAVISQTLDPGIYYLACAFQGSGGGAVDVTGMPSNVVLPFSSDTTNPPTSSGFIAAPGFGPISGVTGALPSTVSASGAGSSSGIPLVSLRAA